MAVDVEFKLVNTSCIDCPGLHQFLNSIWSHGQLAQYCQKIAIAECALHNIIHLDSICKHLWILEDFRGPLPLKLLETGNFYCCCFFLI